MADQKPDPKLTSGYHYHSSRRHPREPENCLCTPAEEPRFVGYARIDGYAFYAFRCKGNNGRPFYAFQLSFGR